MSDASEGLSGRDLIDAERKRQIEVEGWSPEHDRSHGSSRLLRAAEAYEFGQYERWPWGAEWWKPKDALSDLVRAGALYAAAIDLGGFTAAAEAGRARCAEKIDNTLGSPIITARVSAAATKARAEERERIAQAIEAKRAHDDDTLSNCPDGCGWLNFAARIARLAPDTVGGDR